MQSAQAHAGSDPRNLQICSRFNKPLFLCCGQVLCRDGEAVALSRDHTAADEGERARVAAAGGDVRWRADGWRVGNAGLQVTRCGRALVRGTCKVERPVCRGTGGAQVAAGASNPAVQVPFR